MPVICSYSKASSNYNQKDEKYGFCKRGEYSDGGSIEYCYYGDRANQYTILKLNILDGDKDLVIGFGGPILNQYNKLKD